jgi:hypothetical protein
MTTKSIPLFRDTSTMPLVVAALSLGLLTIAMETVMHVPMKIPGHRALPGALALLVFAQAFTPLILLAFAGAVSSMLVLTGHADPISIGVWMVAALAIWRMSGTKLERSVALFLLGGLLFGLLRYLSLMKGFHHTPEIIRLGGHLGFGGVGGLLSYGITQVFGGKRS